MEATPILSPLNVSPTNVRTRQRVARATWGASVEPSLVPRVFVSFTGITVGIRMRISLFGL